MVVYSPLLRGASPPVPPSSKVTAGCRRCEKLLKGLPGWGERRWEEDSLSSSALDPGQTDPVKTLPFQRAAPMGKVSLTVHCAARTWVSALLAAKFMSILYLVLGRNGWINENRFNWWSDPLSWLYTMGVCAWKALLVDLWVMWVSPEKDFWPWLKKRCISEAGQSCLTEIFFRSFFSVLK